MLLKTVMWIIYQIMVLNSSKFIIHFVNWFLHTDIMLKRTIQFRYWL